MISVGGVIGTGLFLGSGTALYHGGPIGALLAYGIIGSVVYCLCVSIGEMIAFLPNVGGVVGLADLYVDPALGFSLGWAAWYNWSVTLPAEITAAAVLVSFWETKYIMPVPAMIGIFLGLAIGINCFSSRVYGEMEFWLSTFKVLTIVLLILVNLIIDLGAGSEGFIGLKNWQHPFAPSYLGITGPKGRFLGFWSVLMQAMFSFFGSEVPGIAAGEVIDATRNVPRALRRVWIRILLFYVGGIFCVGLLVPQSDPRLQGDENTTYSSPFVIALNLAGVKVVPQVVNAALLLSAWSAACSDIYISSRFLFFLARCKHAPKFLATLIRHPYHQPAVTGDETADSSDEEEDDDDRSHTDAVEPPQISPATADNPQERPPLESHLLPANSPAAPQRQPFLVLPIAAVLVSSSMGLLGFLSSSGSSATTAFGWLTAVTSVASLQSWIGMLFTYIRWYRGTAYAESRHQHRDDDVSRHTMQQIAVIKENRHSGQPYLAWYAFIICLLVLFTNGWAVFVHNGWKIAEIEGDSPPSGPASDREASPVSLFLSSYVPIPIFLLLTFGYKLIYQTEMIPLDKMVFDRKDVPRIEPEDPPRNLWEKLVALII
ncbi:Arginine permease CAN1 [Sparassis crispa]|uniref:Arginine permease CAN1 n=1 Tax=Sparassis crispa TaxID=139825 RepID=A0A401GTD4_9APHY|nr:Arginine permease CAN1 [Sparassis crispa]GBE85477.1 Arginine permease CAN1 [Sparassis crispa]